MKKAPEFRIGDVAVKSVHGFACELSAGDGRVWLDRDEALMLSNALWSLASYASEGDTDAAIANLFKRGGVSGQPAYTTSKH